MAMRSTVHAKQEKAVFEAFLAAHPAFAAGISEVTQPDAEFPDITVNTFENGEIDFEIGEWVDGAQMAAAKRRDACDAAIIEAIGPQGTSPSEHFRAVMLCPREDVIRFGPADGDGFRGEFWRLVEETYRRWPAEHFWQSPQGRICRDLAGYPLLSKYLQSVNFDPLVVRGEERPWPVGQPWIFTELRGGSYDPETALLAMTRILDQKIAHYAPFARPTRLIIYYGRAVAYNTPYLGVHTRDFADVAARAAAAIQGTPPFEKIYLLSALEPGLEAFEIYPGCARCS
jgi:hypothetical protein